MSHAEHAGPPASRRKLTRRGLLAASGFAGAGLLLPLTAAEPAAAAPSVALSAADSRLTLQVAAVGAVYPIAFPAFGEAGSAFSRTTTGRLLRAAGRLSAARLASVRSGLAALTGAGLLDVTPQRLLDGLTRLAAAPEPRPLTAVVALAIATVSTRFDPNADAAAQVWLAGLRHMREQGTRPMIAPRTVRAS
jgi:hypothetical protein